MSMSSEFAVRACRNQLVTDFETPAQTIVAIYAAKAGVTTLEFRKLLDQTVINDERSHEVRREVGKCVCLADTRKFEFGPFGRRTVR